MLDEPTGCKQIGFGSVSRFPVRHGSGEARTQDEVFTVLIDPGDQSRPFGEDRLVGDLDGGSPGDRVAVECE